MKAKSKHFIIQILTIFIFVLLILVLIKINIFMESYETCKDDFKVIEIAVTESEKSLEKKREYFKNLGLKMDVIRC